MDGAVVGVDRRLQRRVGVVHRGSLEVGELRVRIGRRRRVPVDDPDHPVAGDDRIRITAERGPRGEPRQPLVDVAAVEQLRIRRQFAGEQRFDVTGGEGQDGMLDRRGHLDPRVRRERGSALLRAVGVDDRVPAGEALAEVQLGMGDGELVGQRIDIRTSVGVGAVGGHGNHAVAMGVDEVFLDPPALRQVVAARRAGGDHHWVNLVADLVAVEVEIGDPRGGVTLEDLQGRSQLGDIPQRGARRPPSADVASRVSMPSSSWRPVSTTESRRNAWRVASRLWSR